MVKSKFSKKQIAGTLLLSSAAIGAVASGTASANKFTDFLGNGLRKTGELVKIAVGDKIGNKLDGHEQIVGTVVGTVTVGLLFALTYVTYRAIRAGFDYYSANKKNNENKKKIEIDNNKKFENIKNNKEKILNDNDETNNDKKIEISNQGNNEINNKVNEKKSESQSISIQKNETDKNINNSETEKNEIKENKGNSNTGTISDNNNN